MFLIAAPTVINEFSSVTLAHRFAPPEGNLLKKIQFHIKETLLLLLEVVINIE